MHLLLASFTYKPMEKWGPISPHGVGTALGFFLGAWLMAKRAEHKDIPRQEVYNAVTWGAVGAIIGARGFYVIGHHAAFHSVKDVLAVWQGGLTMFGGFAGGLILGLWYLRRKGYKIPPALDAAAPGFVVGVIIGRIGDMIIADHLGERTNFFLGYKIPNAPIAPGYTGADYAPGVIVHHTAMYDLFFALILLGAVYLYEKRKPPTGALFAFFAIWYGLQRFLIDFTRNRQLIESHYFGFSGSQLAGVAFAIGGAVAMVRIYRKRGEPDPVAVAATVPPIVSPAPDATALSPEPAVTPAPPPPLPVSPVPDEVAQPSETPPDEPSAPFGEEPPPSS
jgi:phosphatidylglycerol:prolipoprotein diacylglycerol transferase